MSRPVRLMVVAVLMAGALIGSVLAGGPRAMPTASACDAYERYGCAMPPAPPTVVNPPGPRPPEVSPVVPTPPSNEDSCRGGRRC